MEFAGSTPTAIPDARKFLHVSAFWTFAPHWPQMEQTGLGYRVRRQRRHLPEEMAALNSSPATNQNFSRLEREASKKLEFSRLISSRDLTKATRRKTCHWLSAPCVRNGKRGRRRLQ